MEEIEVRLAGPYSLWRTLRPMQRGASDPTMQRTDAGVWRGMLTPAGPASMQLQEQAGDEGVTVVARTFGPGAQWAAGTVADLVGACDDPQRFRQRLQTAAAESRWSPEQHRTIQFVAAAYQQTAWRLPKSHGVWESVLAAVLEQKVTGKESKGAWRSLALEFGDVAPGPVPVGLRVPPTPEQIRLVPSWRWRNFAVDRPRSDAILQLAARGASLGRLLEMTPVEARAALTSVRGVGAWTYAEVAQRALGDADAVSVGDYHLAHWVVYSITGRRHGTDEEMLHLLAPFAGDRYRAVRMIEMHGRPMPRRGPRMSIPRHRYG